MAESVYEGMFLLDSNRYARDASAAAGKINEMIEKSGGSVLVSRLWAEQRLAYPVEGHRKGTYWLTYFRIEGTRLKELERASQLNNTVLRQLFLAVDDRLVDAMVAHATSASPVRTPSETTDTNLADGAKDSAKDKDADAVPAEAEKAEASS